MARRFVENPTVTGNASANLELVPKQQLDSSISGLSATYQPIDSDLTAIAAIAPSNDDVIQRKSGAWINRTPVQLLADMDSDLVTIAGLSPSNDDFIQRKSGAWVNRSMAQLKVDLSLLKPYPPVTLTPGTTPALDASLGTHFRTAMAQNQTIGIPSNPTEGQVITIEATSDATPRTLALNTGTGGFRFGSDIPALSIHAASKTDYVQAVYRTSTNKWDVIGYVKGF